MDEILSYKRKEEDDYYAILGCDELSSTEQILAEYKARVRSCHPDKVPDDSAAAARFVKLQRVKDVLCNEQTRAQYDRWRRSGLAVPFEAWQTRLAVHHSSMHWAMKPAKEAAIESARLAQQMQPTEPKQSANPDNSDNVDEQSWLYLRRKFRNYEI